MAEWPFTELFQAGKSTPGNGRAYLIATFDQGHALLPQKSDTVKHCDQHQKNKKANSKEYFGSEQLPNEIHLQKQDDTKQKGQTFSQPGLFGGDNGELFSAVEY